jgi:hypothetical protein
MVKEATADKTQSFLVISSMVMENDRLVKAWTILSRIHHE